jgi:hypothetical protein
MAAMRVLMENWMVESGEVPEPRLGETFDAALELWCRDVRHAGSARDSIVFLDEVEDPWGHRGAMHEIAGEICWREGDSWFLRVGDLPLAGNDLSMRREPNNPHQLRAYCPANGERTLVVASVAVAPEGLWPYWPKANASRRWIVGAVFGKTGGCYLFDASVAG